MRSNSILLFVFVTIIFSSPFICAQESDTTSQNLIQKNFSISGEIGAYGELYSMKGQPERRPRSTGRVFFRPTLNLFNLIQIPFEFLLSTEGNSARQNINQFGINPSWDWGTLHLGDFTEDYSQYTLSGINIRGGGIIFKPGNFRFSAATGYTQRSVPGGAQDGSFKRFLYAAKLGYGNEESSYVDLIFLRAKDDLSSLNQSEKSITVISPNGNDILEIGSLQTFRWNSFGIGSGIKIELSRDGGTTFELVADNQPNVGFYNWTVSGAPTFLAIIKLTALEDSTITDVSDLPFTIGSGVESQIVSNAEDVINQNAVTPQENLIVGTKGKVNILENKVSVEFDGAGSIYTRDLRSSEINTDSSNIPSFINKIYNPRVGTNYDYAFNTFLNLNFSQFNTKLGYKRIGPGYNSLGTSYMINDIVEYSFINSLRISKVGINFAYILQKDNLLDQKQFTTDRNVFNIGLAAMITEKLNASVSANIMSMNNDAADSIKTDFGSFVINTNLSYLIDPQGLFRNINLNYAYQNTDNKSYNLKNNKTSVNTLNIGGALSFQRNLNATLTAGFISSSIFDTIKTTTQNYGVMLQHNAFENKLTNNANVNYAKSESNSSIRFTIGSGYQFSFTDILSVSISYMKFTGSTFKGGNFNELISSLNYVHRF